MPRRLKFDDFEGTIPYDAQYVGTFQPLLGWVGRMSKERAQDEMSQMILDLMRRMRRDARSVVTYGDRMPAAVIEPQFRGVRPFFKNQIVAIGQEEHRNGNPRGRELALRSEAEESRTSARYTRAETARGSWFSASRPRDEGHTEVTESTRLNQKLFQLLKDEPSFKLLVEAGSEDHYAKYLSLKGWLGEIGFADRRDAQLLLSPIGLLDLYRQYYYDFGTFLGPPIEHVWIAPRSQVELVEAYSRTDYRFREFEAITEISQTEETSRSDTDEFSEEVSREQSKDLSTGISAEGGVNFEVWHVSGSASLDYSNSLTQSKSMARQTTRAISNKVATEMKRHHRITVRESVQITSESRRRHSISNPSDQLINYELRRKYRCVGVQVQHLGTQLCWQVYLDDPSKDLGLAEMIHIAAPENYENEAAPEEGPPALKPIFSTVEVTIPLEPWPGPGNRDREVDTNNDFFLWEGGNTLLMLATDNAQVHPNQSDDVIVAEFERTADLPEEPGYVLKWVEPTGEFQGTDPNHKPPSLWNTSATVTSAEDGKFKVILHEVNFQQHSNVKMNVKCTWEPSKELKTKLEDAQIARAEDYDKRMAQRTHEQLVQALRDRIDKVSQIRRRDAEDLRQEERTIVYRRLIERLIGDRKASDYYLLSETIRAIFDVDKMLYFVSPDWWRPRAQRGDTLTPPQVNGKDITPKPADQVRFGAAAADRDANYWITENSEPAPFGSSIGWLLQIDGDRYRNAFLNSSWVKAVLPIRPGREMDAIAWLKQGHVEGVKGLDAKALDDQGRPGNETVEQRLQKLARTIAQTNSPDRVYQASQQVYENGFNPLDDAFRLSGEPLEVFTQWVEILPTRQIVPVPYRIPDDQSDGGEAAAPG